MPAFSKALTTAHSVYRPSENRAWGNKREVELMKVEVQWYGDDSPHLAGQCLASEQARLVALVRAQSHAGLSPGIWP